MGRGATLAVVVVGAAALAWVAFLRRWSRTSQGTPNIPPPAVWGNLVKLAWASQPMLKAGGHVTSAYRSPETNAALRRQGSVETSRHLTGLAVDVVPGPGITMDGLDAVAASNLKSLGGFWEDAFIHGDSHVHAELPAGITWAELAHTLRWTDLAAELSGVRSLLSAGTVEGGEATVKGKP